LQNKQEKNILFKAYQAIGTNVRFLN